MNRFFEIVEKNHTGGTRKLNLSDMGLGDAALKVVAKILKNNKTFSQVNLSKNIFSNAGLKELALVLANNNNTIVHLNIGANLISIEGATYLFKCL